MATELTDNLNETIAAAVKAQVQAKVLEALSGSDFFEKYISAVLTSPVEVPDPNSSYGKIRVPFLENAVSSVIKKATQAAVLQAVEEQREQIQESVRKAVKAQADNFGKAVADGLVDTAKDEYGYGFKIEIATPKQRRQW